MNSDLIFASIVAFVVCFILGGLMLSGYNGAEQSIKSRAACMEINKHRSAPEVAMLCK